MASRTQLAEALMADFATRTGVVGPGPFRRRYLWTDAFAVMNFVSLYRHTGHREHLGSALRLVRLVHEVLGRHRDDDPRNGWLSGLGERDAALHPTRGGLRIGKRLPERDPAAAGEDRLEWDRDGQYFHYLTRWMGALECVARATGDPVYVDWAIELARTAHRAFAYDAPDGCRRMRWKMSIDLTRPLVASMGQLDPLDGLVTFGGLEAAAQAMRGVGSGLAPLMTELGAMCAGSSWVTGDELGIGGLLTDAAQLVRLIAEGHLDHLAILDEILVETHQSLRHFAVGDQLDRPAAARLAFRELGLSIGLQSVEPMREQLHRGSRHFSHAGSLLARVDAIAKFMPLIGTIERFWMNPAGQSARTWTDHLDINTVMLATSLCPQACPMIDEPAPRGSPMASDRDHDHDVLSSTT